MYGIISEDIFDSSLMADGGGYAVYVFMSMISLADKDHTVRIDSRLLARKIDLPLDKTEAALTLLCEPDPNSNITDYEGKRIIPLSELDEIEGNRGYFIVNRANYINKVSKNNSKDRVTKHRKKEKILHIFSDLQVCNVTETLQPEIETVLSIFISISISLDLIIYIIKNNIDLLAWAEYEQYRKQVKKKPLQSDQGRKRQLHVLEGRGKEDQRKIIQDSIDNEWVKLVAPEDKTGGSHGSSSKPDTSAPGRVKQAYDEKLSKEQTANADDSPGGTGCGSGNTIEGQYEATG